MLRSAPLASGDQIPEIRQMSVIKGGQRSRSRPRRSTAASPRGSKRPISSPQKLSSPQFVSQRRSGPGFTSGRPSRDLLVARRTGDCQVVVRDRQVPAHVDAVLGAQGRGRPRPVVQAFVPPPGRQPHQHAHSGRAMWPPSEAPPSGPPWDSNPYRSGRAEHVD